MPDESFTNGRLDSRYKGVDHQVAAAARLAHPAAPA